MLLGSVRGVGARSGGRRRDSEQRLQAVGGLIGLGGGGGGIPPDAIEPRALRWRPATVLASPARGGAPPARALRLRARAAVESHETDVVVIGALEHFGGRQDARRH